MQSFESLIHSITRDRKIILGYANGYTYEELSKIFEVPLGTIKSKIHHVRKRFKNLNTI